MEKCVVTKVIGESKRHKFEKRDENDDLNP